MVGAESQMAEERIPAEAPFRPILDRVLIKRVEPEAAVDGFSVPEKYRQMSNVGVIIGIGHGVVLGREWHSLSEFVQVGQKCLYGEYTAERWDSPDGQAFWIVRLQDIRGIIPENQ